MTGQKELLKTISELVSNNTYPRFSIFVGKKGCGKKHLVKELSKMLNCEYFIWGNKIDDIRGLLEIMIGRNVPTIYCIPNYEDMSVGARNSLLKMCEEPTSNSYIILTSSSKEIILPTLLGRGTVFEFCQYTEDDLFQIEKDLIGIEMGHSREDTDKIVKLCEVPGDLEHVRNMDIDGFVEFMNRFWENIGKSSAGNALKVTGKIKLKEDSNDNTLYDINIFINYLFKLNSNSPTSVEKSKIFDELISAKKAIQLKYNKQYILDDLILNIRSIKNGVV